MHQYSVLRQTRGETAVYIPMIERATTAARVEIRKALTEAGIPVGEARIEADGIEFPVIGPLAEGVTNKQCQNAIASSAFFALMSSHAQTPYLDNLPGCGAKNPEERMGDLAISLGELKGLLEAQPRPIDLWDVSEHGGVCLHSMVDDYGCDMVGAVDGILVLDNAKEILKELALSEREEEVSLELLASELVRATAAMPEEQRDPLLACVRRSRGKAV